MDDQDPSQNEISLHSCTGSSDAEKRLTPPQGGVFLCLQGLPLLASCLTRHSDILSIIVEHRGELFACRQPVTWLEKHLVKFGFPAAGFRVPVVAPFDQRGE